MRVKYSAMLAVFGLISMAGTATAQTCQWSAVGSGLNAQAYALTVFDDGSGAALYAGGEFTTAGGLAASHIAKWDGTQWAPLGSGLDGGTVQALTTFDDGTGLALYAGGGFDTAGGMPANYIAKWDGTQWWSPLGSGNWFQVQAFSWPGTGPLYLGGSFSPVIEGMQFWHIATWNGTQWGQLGTGMNATSVNALAILDDGTGPELYAAGQFTTAGDLPANNIARWGCGR